MPLDDELHADIMSLCDRAEQHAGEGEFDLAIPLYQQALDRLPQPVEDFEAATFILSSMGDAAFQQTRYEEAVRFLEQAVHGFRGQGNPFIHLRLGQALWESGDTLRGAEELARAFAAGGEGVFEHEDPRYLSLVKEAVRPPGLN